MGFTELVWFMLGMVKASSQNALERFFPQAGKADVRMTRQAFSAARQKIKWEAFEELLPASIEGSYHEDWRRWRRCYTILRTASSWTRR
jgi:hypothetical protein